MNISWYGHACFRIVVKGRPNILEQSNQTAKKGSELTIVTDPFDKSVGLTPPRFGADIILVSHNHYDHNNTEPFKGAFLISEPGEYEVRGLFIKGINAFHDNKQGQERGSVVIFKIEVEGINLVHLGDLGQSKLSDEQLEQLGEVDILMIPVGGKYTTDADQAQTVVAQIEPRLVIPMHYKTPGLKLDIKGVEQFLKVMGTTDIKPVDKLSLKVSDLSKQEAKVVVFNPPMSH